MKAVAILALLCVAASAVSAESSFRRMKGALEAKRQMATSGLGQGMTRAQIMSEYKQLLSVMEELELNDKSSHAFSMAKSTARIAKVKANWAPIEQSVDAFQAKSGAVAAAGNANWWIHSGTASYLYGIRKALTDVDGHWHGMPGNVGHIEYKANTVGNPVEVDIYDPCVDKHKPFFETLEAGIRVAANSGAHITAELVGPKKGPYRIITLNQLKFEYENLVKDAARQANPNKKISDAETLAGLAAAGKEEGIEVKADPLGF